MQLMDRLVGDKDLTTCFQLIGINPQLIIDGGEVTPLAYMNIIVLLVVERGTAITHPLTLFFGK